MINRLSDTLVVDSARLSVWRQDNDYDYGRELVPSQFSLMDWSQSQIQHFLELIFGNDFYLAHASTIWIMVVIFLVICIGIFLLKRYPALFSRSGKIAPMSYDVTEDTIYGVDFETEIEKAMARQDYREALRLIYLQTLKALSDLHLVDWQPFKTPTQYSIEWKNNVFRQMTNCFIRVRYGNFEASLDMVKLMQNYKKTMMDAINQEEEGGEHER